MHLGLWLLLWPVRLGLIRSLVRLAPALCAAAGPISWFGSDRGGMLVGAEGLDTEGRRLRVRWSLVAAEDCGPFVPVRRRRRWSARCTRAAGPLSIQDETLTDRDAVVDSAGLRGTFGGTCIANNL